MKTFCAPRRTRLRMEMCLAARAFPAPPRRAPRRGPSRSSPGARRRRRRPSGRTTASSPVPPVSHARSDTRSDASANAAARNGAASAAKAASSADEPSHTAANVLSTASRVSGHGSRLPEIDASDDVSDRISTEYVSDALTNASLNAGNRTVQRARSERSTSDSFATEPTHAQAASRLSCFLCASSKRSAGTSSRTAILPGVPRDRERRRRERVPVRAFRALHQVEETSEHLAPRSRDFAARRRAREQRSNSRLSATSVALATRGSASASARDRRLLLRGRLENVRGRSDRRSDRIRRLVCLVCVCESDRRRRRSDRIRRLGVGTLRARARRSSASAFLNSRVLPSRSASRCFAVAAARSSRASRSRVRFPNPRWIEPRPRAGARARPPLRVSDARAGRRDAARQRRRLRLLRRQSALQGFRANRRRARAFTQRIVRGVPRVQPRGAVNGAAQAVGGNGESFVSRIFHDTRKRIRLVAERQQGRSVPAPSR